MNNMPKYPKRLMLTWPNGLFRSIHEVERCDQGVTRWCWSDTLNLAQVPSLSRLVPVHQAQTRLADSAQQIPQIRRREEEKVF